MNIISDVMGIKYDTYRRWYKNVLSDYSKKEVKEALHENDIGLDDPTLSNSKPVLVPILRPEHIGTQMAIDEKYINQEFNTVLTNGNTGKVAMICASMNPKIVTESLQKFGDKLNEVTELTRDLSPTFAYIGNQNFPNAHHIADKFHVIRLAIQVVQDVRIRLKTKEAKELRLKQKEHELLYQENQKKTPETGKIKLKKEYTPPRLENGETAIELLSRSRYLLYKLPENRNESQKKRASLLYKYFPSIKTVYELINQFRRWYEPNYNDTFIFKQKHLWDWMNHVEQTAVDELLNFLQLVKNNEDTIVNYFKNYHTNAIAESTNAKIQHAIFNNKGTRDIDFFNFRLGLIF